MRQLNLWVLPNNGFDTLPQVREHLGGYQREHPGARVVARVRTKSVMWDELFRMIKDPRYGRRPDVVQIPAHWTPTLAHLGILQDLKELDSAIDLQSWTKLSRENCRLDDADQIFSLPWWMELRVLYYRRDALRQVGKDPAADLATWDGMTGVCRALKKRWKAGSGRFPIANPNPRETVSLADLAPCVWSRGGDFFSKDGSRCLFQREDAARGIGAYFDLINEGCMPLIGANGLPPGDLFGGNCAMQISGRFPRPDGPHRIAPKIFKELGARPFPSDGRPGVTAMNVQSLAVIKDCESPRRAYGLLRELVRGSAAASYSRMIGAFPAIEGGLKRSLEEYPEMLEVFGRALQTARTLPNLKVLGTIEKVFNRNMERLVRSIMHKRYGPQTLRKELIHASAEIDYVLSVYQSGNG